MQRDREGGRERGKERERGGREGGRERERERERERKKERKELLVSYVVHISQMFSSTPQLTMQTLSNFQSIK